MDHHARLLDGLTDSQRHAVVVEAAPLCILAGAGSGKTRVLTRRIAWRIAAGTAHPGHVLALTFTRKAAEELRRRLAALGVRDQVAAGTFHAVAYAQLRRRWADQGQAPLALLDRKARILAPLLGGGGMSPSGPGARGPATPPGAGGLDPPVAGAGAQRARVVADLAAEIEWAKARLVDPEGYPAAAADAGRRPPLALPDVAALYRAYEADKRRRGLVDFDDLLVACAEAVESDPEMAAGQRWRFRHLFVDELQDLNPAQFRLLQAWLGDRLDLCVVGDPRQAIYSWNGADPSVLTHLPRHYPSTTVVHLEDNWRSSPQVLAVAGAVLGRARSGPAGLRAHRPDGPVPTVADYESDTAEARGIARGLRQARGAGRAWSHLAVLARTNAQLVALEEALRALQVPYRLTGSGPFLALPEIRAALGRLRRLPPGRPFAQALADLEETASEAGASRGTALAGGDDPRAHLETLVRLGGEYQALDPGASVEGFGAWLAASLSSDGAGRTGDAVELATFHRAKGLEWPVVFLAGLEQGLVPIGHATTPAAQEEERRLLYVALTRAEEELHCSWARRRTFGSRTLARAPSPYLEAIDAACAALSGTPLAAGVGHLAAAERARLEDGDDRLHRARSGRPAVAPERPALVLSRSAEPELVEALRAWRSAAARASGVPAYVILHDATLASVATEVPTTVQGLMALPGLGPVKASRYGAALLDILERHRASA